MSCLSQLSIHCPWGTGAQARWRTFVCGPPMHPVPARSGHTSRSEKSSRISKHEWSRPRRAQDNKKTSSRTYVRVVTEAELEDRRPAPDTRVLESELEHEHATFEEERKRTTEPKDGLAFLELEVASSSTRVSKNCRTS